MTPSALWLSVCLAGIQVTAIEGEAADVLPRVGEPVSLQVTGPDQHPQAGQTVRVIHRPGLAAEQEQAIGITDARGTVEWTPALPGVARVRAGRQDETFLVDGGFPLST